MTVSVEFAIAARLSSVWRAGLMFAVLALGACGCNSMSGHVNNQVGMWDYRQGNYVAARVQFSRAAADEPTNASFAYNLACAMKHTGDPTGAEQTYRHAIQLDPTHQPAYHGLALLMNEEGRRTEALQLISTWAVAQPRHPGAQIELAWIERQNGDTVASEQALYQALALDPGNPIATGQLGQLYQGTGQTERAMAMYQRSLHGNWMQPEVQSRLASLREANGFGNSAPPMIAGNPGVYPVAALPVAAPIAIAPSEWPTATAQRNGTLRNIAPGNDDPAHL